MQISLKQGISIVLILATIALLWFMWVNAIWVGFIAFGLGFGIALMIVAWFGTSWFIPLLEQSDSIDDGSSITPEAFIYGVQRSRSDLGLQVFQEKSAHLTRELNGQEIYQALGPIRSDHRLQALSALGEASKIAYPMSTQDYNNILGLMRSDQVHQVPGIIRRVSDGN